LIPSSCSSIKKNQKVDLMSSEGNLEPGEIQSPGENSSSSIPGIPRNQQLLPNRSFQSIRSEMTTMDKTQMERGAPQR
jgi:hypothetical protein